MLVNINTVVAVRCPWCGSIQLNSISPFQLSGGNQVTAKCQCGEELFTLRKRGSGKYQMKISCIACDYEHNYRLGYKELWKKDICVLSCLYTHIEVCFLGKRKHVVEAVERYEKELEEIINELGIEEFLDDEDLWSESFSQFMDTIERINFNKDLGKNKVDSLAKGPEQSK